MRTTFVTTCGVSVLSNHAEEEVRRVLRSEANSREFPPALRDHLLERGRTFGAASLEDAAELSAEINSLKDLGSGRIPAGTHLLIASDTALGRESSELVRAYLARSGVRAETYSIPDLVTHDLDCFRSGVANLVAWCEAHLRDQGRVVFNLTGGFKALPGVMQALGVRYADEVVYRFETGALLRIPRLPVRWDVAHWMREKQDVLRRLEHRGHLPLAELGGVPETFLFVSDDQATFSDWGRLEWAAAKDELYGRALLAPASPRLRYTERFKRDAARLDRILTRRLNERLDQLAAHLDPDAGANTSFSRGLDFKPLQGPAYKGSTHECDAYDGKRIFGHFDGQIFVLDRLEEGLH